MERYKKSGILKIFLILFILFLYIPCLHFKPLLSYFIQGSGTNHNESFRWGWSGKGETRHGTENGGQKSQNIAIQTFLLCSNGFWSQDLQSKNHDSIVRQIFGFIWGTSIKSVNVIICKVKNSYFIHWWYFDDKKIFMV